MLHCDGLFVGNAGPTLSHPHPLRIAPAPQLSARDGGEPPYRFPARYARGNNIERRPLNLTVPPIQDEGRYDGGPTFSPFG